MKKPNRKVKKLHQLRTNAPKSPQPIAALPKNESKLSVVFNKTNLIVGFVAAIVSLIGFYFTFPDYFKTQKEKYEKDTFVEGTLTPPLLAGNQRLPYSLPEMKPNFQTTITNNWPKIKGIYIKDFEKKDWVFVFVSGYVFTCLKEDLKRGIDIFNPLFKDCAGQSLNLVVKDSRLYVSVEFKDLQKEETIGIIEYNHWQLYRQNMFDYDNTDEKLEVRDKQANIVFSIEFEEPTATFGGMVEIGGYFIGNSSIIVMPNDPKKSKSINPLCLSKTTLSWKSKALYEIERIQSIFPNKYKPQ